jgi:DNA-binding MarR family transcriptional regulator
MRLSERAVFLALLERADNSDCTIPGYMTPSLVQLAASCCCSKSAVAAALTHLESHGWLTRARGKGGRSHKTAYRLTEGSECLPGCPKRSTDRTVSEQKRSTDRTPKRSKTHSHNPRSDTVSDEGLSEGEDNEGTGFDPHWKLVRELCGIVHSAPGGGLHRDELAERLHVPGTAPVFRRAFGVAYGRKWIDVCGSYIVRPPDAT